MDDIEERVGDYLNSDYEKDSVKFSDQVFESKQPEPVEPQQGVQFRLVHGCLNRNMEIFTRRR